MDNTKAKGVADGVPVFCSFDEIKDTSAVIPNPMNPNQHPEAQLKLLAKIIKNQGWRAPITVSTRSGFIVRGHGRLKAAQMLGKEEVPVDYQHYENEAEEYADLIADNRIAELAELDKRMLVDMINEIDTGVIEVELTGYTEQDIKGILAALEGANDTVPGGEDDIPPAPTEPRTKPGDVWLLGEHRLICGDSTDQATMKRLFKGERAAMVHTDPPYGVSYVSQSGKFEEIKNDELTGDNLVKKLLMPAFKLAAAYTKDDAAFYIWHASSTRKEFEFAMQAAGLVESQYIIWAKNAPVLGHADYQWAHEPCYYASKQGNRPAYYGDRAQQTLWRATLCKVSEISTVLGTGVVLLDGEGGRLYVAPKEPKGKKIRHIRITQGEKIELQPDAMINTVWEVARETGTEHPTQKPVELARRAIENSSQPGDIIFDGFGGSGSTLIGAEMTGRTCYTIEYAPQYCDVIISRWERLTGRTAVKEVE